MTDFYARMQEYELLGFDSATAQMMALSDEHLDAEAREERRRALREMAYCDYLETPEWRERADAVKERAGYRCQLCNGDPPLVAHHRTYERRGDELDADLIALCRPCHDLHHFGQLAIRTGWEVRRRSA